MCQSAAAGNLHAYDGHTLDVVIADDFGELIQEDIWGNRNILSKAGQGQTFAAAYACASGSKLNVSVIAETPVTVMFLNVKRILNVCPSACSHHSRVLRNLLNELAGKKFAIQ